ncbi:sigma 54 modulation/S30EA-like ribosomal protein [Nocardia mexicana]|uniref:Sigma 54 modulation/S30EA-like ribosomal protein n=1 Tax=Nocardia mexicana TaxID=279262 RepID=A0A370HDW2_9NOCA|nr:sigma 54 modulation/S30EA-like ribosomal protein [Nocardia mexicana]
MRVSAGHNVSADAVEYAREKIGRAVDYASEPVLSARVRLTGDEGWSTDSVVAQANVNIAGRAVRVQVTAASTREAVDLLQARLRARLARLSRNWEALRGNRSGTAAHEWRHDGIPRARLPYFPRPADERQVVRHKSYALAEETADEAAFDMELMDYDFHLFTESGSHVDSVLYRAGPSGYRMAQVYPSPDEVTRGSVPMSTSPWSAPALSVEGAIVRLELTGWPFVFFRHRALDRGCVLYHRYDGHYGLITPSTTGKDGAGS